ncbi:hypothetical protein QJS66_13665 [Kocuria rhizophila]|nr:hypothetical protein QJS66_13665 [Kocuria rhizophila]
MDAVAGRAHPRVRGRGRPAVMRLHITTMERKAAVLRALGVEHRLGRGHTSRAWAGIACSIAGAEDLRVNSGYGYYKGKAVQSMTSSPRSRPSRCAPRRLHFVPATVGRAQPGLGWRSRPPCSWRPPCARRSRTSWPYAATAPREARHEILAVRAGGGAVATARRRPRRRWGTWGGQRPSTIEAPYLGRGVANSRLIRGRIVTATRFEDWLGVRVPGRGGRLS